MAISGPSVSACFQTLDCHSSVCSPGLSKDVFEVIIHRTSACSLDNMVSFSKEGTGKLSVVSLVFLASSADNRPDERGLIEIIVHGFVCGGYACVCVFASVIVGVLGLWLACGGQKSALGVGPCF